MYRNRLEILSHLLIVKSLVKYFIIGVYSWLSSWLNKCNYMEYIRGIEKWLQSPLKGTIQRFSHKGTSECEKVLDTVFFNLVNFVSMLVGGVKPFVVVAGGGFVTTLQLG